MSHFNHSREKNSAHEVAFSLYLRTGEQLTTSQWRAKHEQKFNPYHREDNGQFDFAPGGASRANGGGARQAESQKR